MRLFLNLALFTLYSKCVFSDSFNGTNSSFVNATVENSNLETVVIAGALGGIGGLLILLGLGKWYQNKQMTERRKQRLEMTSRFVRDVETIYGIKPSAGVNIQKEEDTLVMYSTQGFAQKQNNLTATKKQMETYRKTLPLKITNDSSK